MFPTKEKDSKHQDFFPEDEHLVPGLYVAVWYDEEWHRGQILEQDPQHGLYKVCSFT
jgi:hypothetical protein